MCLGIPGRVRELLDGYGGQLALVDVEGAPRKVNIGMLDEGTVTAGDWVVIHMGFAVEKVDEQGAQRARAGLELMGLGQDGEIDESDTRTGEVGT
ncbi:Hydrogenase maturation protein HypC [Rhodococcus erythropolis]|jgi:hydrogenase expression/formation protein HypC|uniref:Putative hydrogenase maturation protein HypC n=1 Tax=Rhodococcus erythropolis (strain PR4 / NBRC 100887) TaxID=234621 RepID=C0ZYD1_RHOE4|nr:MULTISPECIES: HypC/HybG/HupF family hydrogenase formation chaperone [Rhodococcus]ERB53035.1 hydrogenase maturation protein HypC [Rhodococcus sp. P27]RAL33800.1 HypC/HybG/HupF family hydrogenase formation chaperone [Rhodococcus sp. AQ5-07]BAH33366.1 putative hydrogenase maturation protein HypC [Rhodococcus erythropolis PR4]SCY76482.1 Hydrogenase maturation protein HypC [Rhodococcus erythropolis]